MGFHSAQRRTPEGEASRLTHNCERQAPFASDCSGFANGEPSREPIVRWQQQSNQYPNDSDDCQQLD